MGKAVRTSRCSTTRAVEIAAYQLESLAEWWYKNMLQARPVRLPPMTWEEFTEAFMMRFLSASTRARFATKFKTLTQTQGMTIVEYDAKFTKLSCYALHLVETETLRAA